MDKLTKLASIEVYKSNESAGKFVSGISDSLHDILLYLNENKNNLPTESEVSIDELFQLMNKAIEDMDDAGSYINISEKWLYAMTTFN